MKKNKLDRFETKTESAITPEQDKQNREIAANMLLAVVEKMQNLPPVPTPESFDDLMKQFDNPKRSPVVIHHADGRRIRYDSGGDAEIISEGMQNFVTKNDLSDAEKRMQKNVTKDKSGDTGTFTEAELLILEQFKK